MSPFRRRRTESDNSEIAADTNEIAADASAEELLLITTSRKGDTPNHVERALVALTTKMQQCIERVDSLEHRIEELNDATMHVPSHGDVLEVRLHSAKLAAELARTTVELRGEIGLASNEARRATRVARTAMEADEAPVVMPVDLTLTALESVDDDEQPNPGFSASA